MLLRHYLIASAAFGLGIALLAGEAAAQFRPPAPYSYPPGGYRGVPLPDDDEVMTLDPDEQDAPYQVAPAPAPAAPRAGRQGGYPYDPRIDNGPNAYRPDPRAIDPNGVSRAPVYGHYGDQPGGGVSQQPLPDQASRPPAVIEAGRPPLGLEPNRGAAATPSAPANIASLPADDQPEVGEPKELPPQFKRQIVDYVTKEPAGTIIIDTPSTYLYYVLGGGKAVRYGIGVGRQGFTWAGTEKITKLAEWPDWHPPAEMIERQPYLPRFMAGGPGNPLGARALYLGKTEYRIHGTNQPSTIGKFVSSGCIRMLNDDVEDLYGRVKVGTRVMVRPGADAASASASSTAR